YDNVLWMKLSEIARYWAARTLTTITQKQNGFELNAPFACREFTVELPVQPQAAIRVGNQEGNVELRPVKTWQALQAGSRFSRADGVSLLCFDLPRGVSSLEW
ncbi:MAG: hypothetical protein KDA85_22495, partial [Planctomycetaceae bacterium]|nr:hypothetical protein [Planctomycetaceae bacterium]